MKITYDVRDSDPEKARGREGFEKPKPGVYPAKVVSIEKANAKDERSGKPDPERPMLVVQYQITKNKKGAEGSWMWDRVPLNSEAAKWKLDQFLLAFGITDGKTKRKGSFDADELVGEPCRIRVKDGTYKGEYSPDVGAVLAPSEDDEDEDDDPTVDDELGGEDGDDLDGEDGEGEDDGEDEDVLYYDMTELAGMQLDGLKQVAEDLGLEIPAAKSKSRVSLSKWIFENQPAEPPEDEDVEEEDGDDSEDDLEALGEAADGEDDEAIDRLTALAGENDLDPDEFDTWADLATALAGAGGDDEDGEGDSEEDGYDELDDKALKAELKDRGLSVKGTKDALIKRLRQDDATDPF